MKYENPSLPQLMRDKRSSSTGRIHEAVFHIAQASSPTELVFLILYFYET
jgi:hypothetical protein